MLLHCGFGFFGVDVFVLILFSARSMCLALCMENVLPMTCLAHCFGVWAWCVFVNHFVPYACFQILFAWVRIFLWRFFVIESWINSLTSFDVFLFSYSFGDDMNVAFSKPNKNSEAIGPIMPWWSMVKGSILCCLVTSSWANCSEVELEGGWSFILNFLYSWV